MSSELIIITGASKGIGNQIAKNIVNRGFKVLGIGRDVSELQALTSELGNLNFHYIAGDLSKDEVIKSIHHYVLNNQLRIKALVNNAATIEPISKISEINILDVKSAFELNLFSVISLTTTLLPLIKQRGIIINISSGASTNPYAGWSAYCCTKAALNMFTSCLAKEHPEILSIAIRPGVVDTEMQQQIRTKGEASMGQDFNKFINLKAMGKLLGPEVPAKVISQLAVEGFSSTLSGKFLSWDDPCFESVKKL